MATSGNVTVTDADYLRLIIHGTTAFELLRTGLEFDLFERLEKAGGMDLAEVASAIGVEEQPARVLLLGLTSILLLEKQGDKYVNSAMAKRKLLRDGERFLGPLIDIQAKIINASLVDFAESMRQNTNVGLRHVQGTGTTLYEKLVSTPDLQKVFYDNMGDASARAFAQILDRYDFSGSRKAIDIGGGDGTNSLELARRYPELSVTVFDQESVTVLAADRITDPDLRGRVTFHPGDMFDTPLPTGADTILFFHIFEIWSLERNTQLLRKCYEALEPGGVCLVYNFVSNDEGTGSMSAGLVSPYFLALASGEGMTYSTNDMEAAVREAGFTEVERYQDMGFSHSLVVGRKTAAPSGR
jgi:cyclopropane fatty-acyl-phospholipid synthase-like methyltransferase